MQLLQIDTIHVVNRSPYFVLFSRLGPYPQKWLDEALERGEVFETWAHEACFAPIEDCRLHRANRHSRDHWSANRARRVLADKRTEMDEFLAHVERAGPVRSSDFAREQPATGGWWSWKAEKQYLEAWFALGELMVTRRDRFQRVYDLTHRVHRGARELPEPALSVVRDRFVERSVLALGITQARWVNDYFRTKPKLKDAELEPWVRARQLVQAKVEGFDAHWYIHREHLALARRIQRGRLISSHTTLLSPFDPVVWDRERAQTLFDFEYRLECYTPEAKRKFGYFVLPILSRGRLVGRLDAKAHRADEAEDGRFEVRQFHLEEGVPADAKLARDIASAIQTAAHWHGCAQVQLSARKPARFLALLKQALKTEPPPPRLATTRSC